MKSQLKLIIFLTIIFSSCFSESKINQYFQTDTNTITQNYVVEPSQKIVNTIIKIEELKQLIPIDIINSKSKNVYEKFGIELLGNCYACDLAELSITDKKIKLINCCDVNNIKELDIEKITNTKNGIEIKTKQLNFIINEMDKAPIYELKIIGKTINNKSFRISKYYTLKKLLKKFKQHDCGDFQG